MDEKYIRKIIAEDQALQICEETADGLHLFDEESNKEFPIHFIERMNSQKLAELIHISSDIPQEYRPDQRLLAEYLWGVCDRNAFVTLNEIVIFWGNPESMGVESERERLYKDYSDEFALEFSDNYLGQLWYDRNIVGINLYQIVETSAEIVKENEDSFSPYFQFENIVIEGLLTTALHELRHLQMDTNIFLPDDLYPWDLDEENAVEGYALNVFENNPFPTDVIPFKNKYISKRSLDQQIRCLSDRAQELCKDSNGKTKNVIPENLLR